MNNSNNSLKSIYESQGEEESKIISQIKKEVKVRFLKYLIPCIFLTLTLMIFLISSTENSEYKLQLNKFNPFFLNEFFSFYWFLFGTTIFLILKIFLIFKNKLTPTLSKFIEKELKTLNLKIKKFNFSEVLYLIILIISGMVFILNDFKIINISQTLDLILKICFSLLLIISLTFQICSNNKRVKLKSGYYISLKIRVPFIKKVDINMIKIYMSSSFLTVPFNKKKKRRLSIISNKRWVKMETLPLLERLNLISLAKLSEFSTHQNFHNKFLNLALAIRDWDKIMKSNSI